MHCPPPRPTLFPYTTLFRFLSLFACEAGAATVTAVEIDPALAELVAATAQENGFHNRMTVINGDARELNLDRKSTRLNSSHGYISYAVFCLKKKITHHHIKQ